MAGADCPERPRTIGRVARIPTFSSTPGSAIPSTRCRSCPRYPFVSSCCWNSSLVVDHHFAEVGAAHQVRVRLRSLVEAECPIDHGMQLRVADRAIHFLERAAMTYVHGCDGRIAQES